MSVSIFEYDEEEEMKLIRKQEREAALEEGADSFAALTARLLADSRTEDLMKATTDKAFRDTLYKEYGIFIQQ